MKSIHIRNVDEDVLHRLRSLAELHHRSLQGELRAILERAARFAHAEDIHGGELDLVTVETNRSGSWRREDIYGDDAR